MTDIQNYQPISCALHDGYELAIMHKTKLKLTWVNERQQACTDILLPLDLVTRNGAEYLVVQKPGGSVSELRLDHIKQSETVKY